MRTVNEFMSYMQGPEVPKELRNGSQNLGAIQMTCYGKPTISSCKKALRQLGKQQSVQFLESFETHLPKLIQLRAMKESLESGQLNPYEPSNQAVYLQRNCDSDGCVIAVTEYMNLQALVRENCSLSKRSNQNQFTVGMSWSCYDPIMEIKRLDSTLSAYEPPLNQAGEAALYALEQSTVPALLTRLEKDSVSKKCDESSPLVNGEICKFASFIPDYFNLVKSSIKNRGISDEGTIDIDRNSIYSITKNYDILSPGSSGDRYKGYLTVKFDLILDSLNKDGSEFLAYYESTTKKLAEIAESKRQAVKRQKAIKEKYETLLATAIDTIEQDGYRLYTGNISNVFEDMQDGILSRDDIDSLVIQTQNIHGRLQEIKGSMLIFSRPSATTYHVALADQHASQVIANGSLAAICGCSMVKIKETLVQSDRSGSLVQVFEIEPYTNTAVEAFGQFVDQN